MPPRCRGRLSPRDATLVARPGVGPAGRIALGLAAAWLLATPAWGGNRIAGRVAEIDAAAGRLVVVDAGRRHQLEVPAGTPIREGGTDRSLGDVHKGDRVVVTLAPGDEARAARISVAGPEAGPQDGGRGTMVPGFADGLDARSMRTR